MLPTPRFRMPVGPRSTYYETDNRQGQSLIRARKPYLVKNALTGLAILGFTFSVYLYTIKAVAQDDFEDVVVPDGPGPRKPNTGPTSAPLGK